MLTSPHPTHTHDWGAGAGVGARQEYNRVQDHINKGEFWQLRRFDQLLNERQRKPIFANFKVPTAGVP